MYDYLIVGAGLFGAVFAREAALDGKKVKIIEARDHIGGNIYTEASNGIQVHKYGAHIFHTNNKAIWNYVNQFADFNRFTNAPLAYFKGKLYNLPFNMNTFYQLWGTLTPNEAKAIIDNQVKSSNLKFPNNLEEQAISLVGTDIYEKLVKGYTEKQWGRSCTNLPALIIKRLPVRFTFDNNYFSDNFQGIPIGGYTNMIENMLEHPNITIKLNTDYFKKRNLYNSQAKKILYTGMIDRFYNYDLGYLDYRSLRFESKLLETENFQGNAVVNYTEKHVPYTRIIEHKHFEFGSQKNTIITKEYPVEWQPGMEPYYPINDQKNTLLFKEYKQKADNEEKVLFGGRLGAYQYYDMHQAIEKSLELYKMSN